jgi:branched-chain amino acid transport system permease protein
VWRNFLQIHTGLLGLLVVVLLLFLPRGMVSLARRFGSAGARHV